MAQRDPDPDNRPVFLELFRIHFPVEAVASFIHRVTGVVLVLAIPAGLALVMYSAESAAAFRRVGDWLDRPGLVLIQAVILAAAIHHLLAGVRLLFMDAGLGVALPEARKTAWGSLAGAGLALVAALVVLWPGGDGFVP